jgi:hypothetical protein
MSLEEQEGGKGKNIIHSHLTPLGRSASGIAVTIVIQGTLLLPF